MKVASHRGRSSNQEASCLGKEKHDRATANMIARKMKSPIVKTYQCQFCGHWHIGKMKVK